MTSRPFGHLLFIKNKSLNPVHTQRKGTTPKCGGGTHWGRVRAPLLMWLARCHPLPSPSVSPAAHSRLWHTRLWQRHLHEFSIMRPSTPTQWTTALDVHSFFFLLGSKGHLHDYFKTDHFMITKCCFFFFLVEVKNKSISRLKSWSKFPGTTVK